MQAPGDGLPILIKYQNIINFLSCKFDSFNFLQFYYFTHPISSIYIINIFPNFMSTFTVCHESRPVFKRLFYKLWFKYNISIGKGEKRYEEL